MFLKVYTILVGTDELVTDDYMSEAQAVLPIRDKPQQHPLDAEIRRT